MEKTSTHDWVRPYLLPIVVMIAITTAVVLLFDESVSGFIAAACCWAVAFVVGYALRPVHPWVTPLVLVVVGVIASYIAAEVGDYDPPGGIWVFIGLVIMAGLPLTFLIWIGREVGLTREEMKPLSH
ncbi:MAG TPA: hypothetical protein VFV93_14455 [Thermomicrobiales bacterium]|nr:hypothetical protein [Thermomicrobiales bacterium]